MDLQIRVLITKTPAHFIAHALELDLLGTGKNEDEAKENLVASIVAQFSLCAHLENLDMFFFKAPAELEQRWLDANKKAAIAAIRGDTCDIIEAKAGLVTVKPSDLAERRRGSFEKILAHAE